MPNCTCDKCISACKHYPGWMTVEEAKAAIAAGFADRLMLDYWAADENVYVLCPTIQGVEGNVAPFWPDGTCTFLANDRCSIHESGFKPMQCRTTMVCNDSGADKQDFLQYWDTDEGRKLIADWEAR